MTDGKSKNGECLIASDRAPGLANYPHARKAGGFIFISGILELKKVFPVETQIIRHGKELKNPRTAALN